MPIATSTAYAHIRHELGGGDLSPELDKVGILNQAGDHLYSMHPWHWAQGRSALLNLRGQVSGTTATWTAASKTLTQASGFTNYTFLAGDQIQIIDGTGATTGFYTVASRTSANAIVLTSEIAAGNLATGDIEWRIDCQTVALPDDLRDIIWINGTGTTIGGITLVSLQSILDMRASGTSTVTGGHLYGAVTYAGEPPVPLLETYPSAGSSQAGAYRIVYRSRWARITADSQQINIPEWMEGLFIKIVRAYAAGYERADVMSLEMRLAEIHASPLFEIAKRSDGMVQPYYGRIKGGGAVIWRRRGDTEYGSLANMVPGPSI